MFSQGKKDSDARSHATRSIIAGSVGGACAVGASYPLWTIKSRLQSNEKAKIPLTFAGLYKGVFANLLSVPFTNAVRIMTVNELRYHLFGHEHLDRMRHAFVTGAGGAVSGVILSPTELVMRRQQIKNCNIFIAVNDLKQKPFKYSMNGSTCSAIRGGLYTVGYYAMMPDLIAWFNQYSPYVIINTVVAGVASGATSAYLSHPFDTVKATQQLKGGDEYVGLFNATKTIYRSSGILGFFKGAVPRAANLAVTTTVLGTVAAHTETLLTTRFKL